jgi:hypothetical protein
MLRTVIVQDTQLALLHAALGEVWGRLYRPRVQSSPGQAAAGRVPATGGLSEKGGLLWQPARAGHEQQDASIPMVERPCLQEGGRGAENRGPQGT